VNTGRLILFWHFVVFSGYSGFLHQ